MAKLSKIEEAVQARDGEEYSRARALLEAAADDGDPYALVLLASMYIEGQGMAVNLEAAERLLDKAAKLGVTEAVFQKANLWHDRGDLHRYRMALQEAARLGVLPATYRLALCYQNGTGVARDSSRALSLMHEAADRGHVGAKMHIARQLLLRPIDPVGFSKGLLMMVASILQSLWIGLRNPHDERFR